VRRNNPELRAARKLGCPVQSYAQALGALTKKYDTIAVSGSHGKSTTTALLALALIEAGLDPTVIVGTKLREFGGKNFRKGNSSYLVIEADEWNKSFHSYFPKVAVVTNIDKEHLDTYKTFEGVVRGFARYFKNMRRGGVLVLNKGDQALRKLGKKIEGEKKIKVIWYNDGKFEKHPLGIPGAMNQTNAEGAWRAAELLGASKEAADLAFGAYQGAWRRMEKLETKNLQLTASEIYSDYAHHPTEIKATLAALRGKYPQHNIVCIFEPHQADRLTRLFNEFKNSFGDADKVIFLPAYRVAGREEKAGKDSFALAQEVNKRKKSVFYAQDFLAATKLIADDLDDRDSVIVFMGAGTIDANARKFLNI
jgi:UDP-N-acetylmuramate--alanine ligase